MTDALKALEAVHDRYLTIMERAYRTGETDVVA